MVRPHQGVRVRGQDLHLGCEFPSGRVDLGLRSLPSEVRNIVSPAGRFLIWLCRRRVCLALAGSCMQTTTERPMFRLVGCFVTWIRCRFSFGSEEDDGCARKANFDEPGAHDAVFRVGLSLHRELANGFRPTACIERTTNIRQRQLLELIFDPR